MSRTFKSGDKVRVISGMETHGEYNPIYPTKEYTISKLHQREIDIITRENIEWYFLNEIPYCTYGANRFELVPKVRNLPKEAV